MLAVPPPRVRQRRPKIVVPVGPAPLVLKDASYNSSALTLLMTFDRAVNVSSVSLNDFIVNDPARSELVGGTGTLTVVGPAIIQLAMTPVGAQEGSTVFLTIYPNSGIAASDGGKFAGVANVSLPFSS